MKIAKITPVGNQPVYDITVEEDNSYTLANGVKSHNTGIMYSADSVIFVGKRQEKDGTDIVGYNFVLTLEKSRAIREKSKIDVNVTYENGIDRFSSLLEWGVQTGHITVPTQGYYSRACVPDDKKWRKKAIDGEGQAFWDPILKDPTFAAAVKEMYVISSARRKINTDAIDEMIDEETGEVTYE